MPRFFTAAVVAGASVIGAGGALAQSAVPAAPLLNAERVVVVAPSKKVCQLTGETDRQTGKPTASQTLSRYGMVSSDHGYAFEHHGKIFFLMGDPIPPPALFKGSPNKQTDRPRKLEWNDMIAFTNDATIDDCLKLDFVTYPSGAYKNPVVMDAKGEPAFTGFINESPEAGVSDGGRMYVIFRTDNPDHDLSKPNTGFATRTAVGVSDDDGNTFRYAYDWSTAPNAHFINVAIAAGSDGYLYFFGGSGYPNYRKSAPYLARKPIGSMATKTPIEYFVRRNADGTPVWSAKESESGALFHDFLPTPSGVGEIADCVGELSAQWNTFLGRWLLLYNCANITAQNPRGIYARVAAQPWGPWSQPTTIFNPTMDGGYCGFIHRAVTDTVKRCDNLEDTNRAADFGAAYGPYIIPRFTTGDAAKATTTFYHVLDTWNPYTQVIMKATIALQR